MDNRLIDLIMNLRICYDKSIEIQLFKELLKTKFLCPISIDDQQNLTINSVVASKQGYHLDMSLESLKDFAQFVRENDVKNDPENIDDFFNSWVYLGEVFRLQAKGAYWTVGTENPKNLNYGLEYLTGYNSIGSEFIPLLIMNNFTLSSPDRLNNNFFYELVLKRLNPKPINVDQLPTEES